MWQDIDEGILPALYGATAPDAEGGTFYGPRGILEMAGGGVTARQDPGAFQERGPTAAGSGRSPSN